MWVLDWLLASGLLLALFTLLALLADHVMPAVRLASFDDEETR